MSTEQKHTVGPWWPGHFVDDAHPCGCQGILSDAHAGAVAIIQVNNGKRVGDGGNDAPTLEEARANAILIAAAPDLLDTLKTCEQLIVECPDAPREPTSLPQCLLKHIRVALAKAAP